MGVSDLAERQRGVTGGRWIPGDPITKYESLKLSLGRAYAGTLVLRTRLALTSVLRSRQGVMKMVKRCHRPQNSVHVR